MYDANYTVAQLKSILRTDPVLPIAHLRYRYDLRPTRERLRLVEEDWIDLCHEEQLYVAERDTTLSKGSRRVEKHFFLCASSKVARFTHWNMRQLSGLAGTRFSLGIHPDHWELMALNRTNTPDQPIPDAIIHRHGQKLLPGYPKRSWSPFSFTYRSDIAVEWDSGSTVRQQLEQKFLSYTKVAQHQLWIAPTIDRANTLLSVGNQVLDDPCNHFGVMAVDWRTGLCQGASLPEQTSPFSNILEETMREVHVPWKW
jgi:hypothetical protein